MSWSRTVKRFPEEYHALSEEQKDALTHKEALDWVPFDTLVFAERQGLENAGWTPRQVAEHFIQTEPKRAAEVVIG